MEKRHYELTDDTIMHNGHKLCRIRATKDNPAHYVTEGDIGGYVEGYSNLEGLAWVDDDAMVYDGAVVNGTAYVAGGADVSGTATVVCDEAYISGETVVVDTYVSDKSKITGNAIVTDSAIHDLVTIGRNAVVTNSVIAGKANINDVDIYDSRQVISAIMEGHAVTVTPTYILAAGCRFNIEHNKLIITVNAVSSLADEWTTEFREWVDRWFNILCALQEKTRNINNEYEDVCRHDIEYVGS